MELRKTQLHFLNQFITTSKSDLNGILQRLGWSEEEVLTEDKLIQCPVDESHRVSERKFDEHVQKCKQNSLGYLQNELFLSEPVNDPKISVEISNGKKLEIFAEAQKQLPHFKKRWDGSEPEPATHDRYYTTFSPDERLAMYDYARKAAEAPPVLPEFNVTQPTAAADEHMTHMKRMEDERNAKRRRIKYKSVHTNHKSHKEVLRDVIENNMDLYAEWLKEKEAGERKCVTEPDVKLEDGEIGENRETSRKRSRSNDRERRRGSRSRESDRKRHRDRDDDHRRRSDKRRREDERRHRRSHRDDNFD